MDYYKNVKNGKVLTKEQYKELTEQISQFQKVTVEQADQMEWLLAKIASGDLNDYAVFYEMEEENLSPEEKDTSDYTLAVVSFEEEVSCLDVFNKLKRNDLKPDANVQQIMLMQRGFDRTDFTVVDFENLSGEKKEWRDSILGIVIGFIGGPLGSILGWAIGDVIGFEQACHEGKKAKNVFHYVANCIPKGKKGILAIVKENDRQPFNQLVEQEGNGTIERFTMEHIKEAIRSLKKQEKSEIK
ncbi:hypothetical protein AALA44_10360 [Enterococcus ratti]|uniref:hypothetical protein n=1 Tax=Enterococcus ratti TaxID=150033 RepID=UPI00351243EF